MHKMLNEVEVEKPYSKKDVFALTLVMLGVALILSAILILPYGLKAKFPAEGYSPDIGATYSRAP